MDTHSKLQKHASEHNCSIRVSTITSILETNLKSIDLKLIDKELIKNTDIHVKFIPDRSIHSITKRGKIKKSFFNQLTFTYQDVTRKSVKIFKNGKIHITGLRSLCDIDLATHKIETILQNSIEKCASITSTKICMMNAILKLGYAINLYNLCRLFVNNKYNFSYTPEVYPAINLKRNYNNIVITFLIFKSGNIIISSNKSMEQLEDNYLFISHFLNTHKDQIV